jgi:hypothetical protein
MKYGKIILGSICLVCILIYCFIAITGKIYTLDELPLNFMSAFLGAIVTAVLTLILLSGQSNAEEIKERNVIVFNKKSTIFEEFIDRLHKILKKQKINGSTYMEIKAEYNTKLVLYLREKSQLKVTDHFMKLVECIGIEINDERVFDLTINEIYNKNYDKLREYIYSIINVLINDLGLGGKMDINIQKKLERNEFHYLSDQILLEEVDNIFMKKDNAFFERARFADCKEGFFVVIPIKGKISSGGRIEIGPFNNNNQGKQERLILRLLAPPFNPLAEEYASSREANVEGKFVNFFNDKPESEYDEYDQIDLSYFEKTNLENLIKTGIEKEDIYIGNIYQFGFDDDTYNQYGGFFVSICKTIAARAFYHFLTAKAEKDELPIKKVCEKFGDVTNEEITDNIAEKQGIDLERE